MDFHEETGPTPRKFNLHLRLGSSAAAVRALTSLVERSALPKVGTLRTDCGRLLANPSTSDAGLRQNGMDLAPRVDMNNVENMTAHSRVARCDVALARVRAATRRNV